jgi:tetratricopeptide (TPR) repeat protein
MRLGYILAGAIAVALSVAQAMAEDQQDANDCSQGTATGRMRAGCTRQIARFTRLLEARGVTKQQQATLLQGRAFAEAKIGEFDSAIADFNEHIRFMPKSISGYLGRCLSFTGKGDFDRAISDCNEVIRLSPQLVSGYSARGLVWKEKGEFDNAIADFNEALRLNPKSFDSYFSRATCWQGKGEFDRAIADYDEAIRLKPKESGPYTYRGATWRLKGDLDRAIADQDRAIRLDPAAGNSFVERGDVLRYKGELNRALADYDHALNITPNDVTAFTGRGLSYEKMGDLARARVEFEKALASNDQRRYDVYKSARETATARLAALDSGTIQPIIPAAPSKAVSATSIPTPSAVTPNIAPAMVANQGRRIALVVGNSKYKNVPTLINPPRDAEAIAAALHAVGFETVTLTKDAAREALVDALRKFAVNAETAEWAVVYYAGHGIEMNGVNYLIPVDATLAADRDVQFEAVPLDQVMIAVEGAKKLKLILLDACRDNPFAPTMRRTAAPAAVAAGSTSGAAVGTRSIGRGLGEVKVSGATLVVFAAKNGQTALDGEGGNSPFAVAVTQRVATPGVEINKLFRLVRDDVMEATAGRQEPYTYGSLPGKEDFFFVTK